MLILAVFFSGQARGEAASEAEKLLEQGKSHFSVAMFQESLQALNQALKVTRDPKLKARILVYIALNHGELGDGVKAEIFFTDALKIDPTVCPQAPPFKETLVSICQGARRKLKGVLLVEASPGCQLLVDNRPRRIGNRLELPIGTHRVEVISSKGQKQAKRVIIYADKEARVKFTFPSPSSQRQPGQKPPVKPKGRLWTWVTAGGAAAALVTAAGLQISVYGVKYPEWQEGATREKLTPAEADYFNGLKDEIEREEITSYALLGVGGALAVTALVLYFVEGSTPATEKPALATQKSAWMPQIIPAVGQSSQGLLLRVHF